MSNQWLKREGPSWVQKQIISQDQYEEILKLYPESPKRITQMLPILASVLIGLSILTFVASNWDGMSQLTRFIVLTFTMLGFYASGDYVYRKGHEWVGQGLLGLGVISFGASMILIGQMFNLIAYDARVFFLWALAGLGTLYLYRRSFFFYLSAVLVFAGQIYAMVSFDTASWMLVVLTVLGLGMNAYHSQQAAASWIFAFLLGLQSILLITSENVAWSWVLLVPIGMYVIGLWLGEQTIAQGFLTIPATFSFGFSTLMVFVHEEVFDESDFIADPVAFLIPFAILMLLALWRGRENKTKWLNLILFLPLFYLPFGDIAYLVVMFIYASLMIYLGDQGHERWKSNIGVFLFMFSSFIGYIQLAWDFLDKSLFFLIGGLILFTIHWVLRKRNRWMTKGEDQS